MVDHRPDLVLVEELAHAIERGSRSNCNAAQSGLAENQRHQAEAGGLASHEIDLGDAACSLGCGDGLVNAVTTSNVKQQVHAFAIRKLQDFVFPLRGLAVVDTGNSTKLLHSREVFVPTGGCDYFGARSGSQLDSEDRDTTGALYEDGLTGLDLAVIDQKVSSGQCSDGKGGRFLIAHVVRGANSTVLMDDHVLSQTTWERRAEAVVRLVRAWFAFNPAGLQMGVNAIAYRKAGDSFANSNDSACSVTYGDQWLRHHVWFVEIFYDSHSL